MRNILDAIAVDENMKRGLIRGEAVDKAEQLSKCLTQWLYGVVVEGARPIPLNSGAVLVVFIFARHTCLTLLMPTALCSMDILFANFWLFFFSGV